jgi:hypothetical protein
VGLALVHARPGDAGKKLAEAARLLARGDLNDGNEDKKDAEHLDTVAEVFGLDLEGAARRSARIFWLWPENVLAWNVFLACGTQWRHGFGGPTGLDYSGVEHVMRQQRCTPVRRRKLWPFIRAAEQGYLTGVAERRQESEG